MMHIDRRGMLKGLGALFGAQVASSLLGGQAWSVAMAFQQTADKHKLQLLSPEQLNTLAAVADLTIPATDTPGALATDCHWFVDNQLRHCFDTQAQTAAGAILDKIEATASGQLGHSFNQAGEDQQLTLLNALEQSEQGFTRNDTQAFKLVKSLLVFGYFTSEVGMTKMLAYDPVPGGFKGSVPYASVGKAYSGGFPF
ncbi:gluconate 2-dehydrogenase subunit 3 family protein [Lacimicrobium alkaliphilum]|uniref:Twin-arginine translocation pathway signal n=1 Tax=Lacimicrobium alkaliphilum TaxID=1526571 RepID=A0A0U3AS06_9ALTE|nr:gluconate 2-dehydrogenase subunit 3 family protein [Lacimicrobium alkaliphilum]ALS96847.1 hypothetical protein AT746_00185 [Lacimicrobium alkaliphilum]